MFITSENPMWVSKTLKYDFACVSEWIIYLIQSENSILMTSYKFQNTSFEFHRSNNPLDGHNEFIFFTSIEIIFGTLRIDLTHCVTRSRYTSGRPVFILPVHPGKAIHILTPVGPCRSPVVICFVCCMLYRIKSCEHDNECMSNVDRYYVLYT